MKKVNDSLETACPEIWRSDVMANDIRIRNLMSIHATKTDLWSFIETLFFQYNLGYTKTAYGIGCRYARDKTVTIKQKPMKFI